jgi:O-antigen ligase
MLQKQINLKWLYIIGVIYIMLNALFIYLEVYYFAALPLVLLVLWAVFFKMDFLLLFIVFCTPVSLNLEQMDIGGIGFYLPTEPLLFGVLVIFVFMLLRGKSIDSRIFKHPISWAIYAYLGWILLTCITSELPVVSFKFLLTRAWYIGAFYFMAIHIFQNKKNFRRYIFAYTLPLCAVIIYTVIRHAGYSFEKDAGHWVMDPFFKDHTSYGAAIAMFVPLLAGQFFTKNMSALLKTLLGIAFIIIITGLVLSFTRAAWLSVVLAMMLLGIMLLKIRFKTLIIATLSIGAFLWFAQDEILITMEKNKQDSSDDLAEHVESMSNVSSDASNLERLNRWNCAFELFAERPLVGWGPGTYQFVYAPYQRSQDHTIISTNNADGGNAHSDYFGPLSEQGLPGAITYLVLIIMVSRMGFRLFYDLKDRQMRILAVSAFLGLFTYIVHGTLNNYLDTDKVSIPFWGMIAILVAIDLFHHKDAEEEVLIESAA